MRILILTVAALSFSVNSYARDYEVQINGSIGSAGGSFSSGTDASVGVVDNGNDSNTSWNLGADIYTPVNPRLQVGGTFQIEDSGAVNCKTSFQIGAQARYNFDTDFMNSVFIDIGLSHVDIGDFNWITLNVGVGKRFAITESIAWTPNIQYSNPVVGDRTEGYSLIFNLVSFSGFVQFGS